MSHTLQGEEKPHRSGFNTRSCSWFINGMEIAWIIGNFALTLSASAVICFTLFYVEVLCLWVSHKMIEHFWFIHRWRYKHKWRYTPLFLYYLFEALLMKQKILLNKRIIERKRKNCCMFFATTKTGIRNASLKRESQEDS